MVYWWMKLQKRWKHLFWPRLFTTLKPAAEDDD
jgi:hypothetical protein